MGGAKLWHDLPFFGTTIRDMWMKGRWERRSEPPPQFELFFRQMPLDEWINLNAFIAKLAGLLGGCLYESTRILNHALEQVRRVDGLHNNVPSAAVWMLYAGRLIYHKAVAGNTLLCDSPYKGDGVLLYHGPGGYSKERWDWRKGRFGWAAENEELQQRTRAFARAAHDTMSQIETTEGEPSGPIDPESEYDRSH